MPGESLADQIDSVRGQVAALRMVVISQMVMAAAVPGFDAEAYAADRTEHWKSLGEVADDDTAFGRGSALEYERMGVLVTLLAVPIKEVLATASSEGEEAEL